MSLPSPNTLHDIRRTHDALQPSSLPSIVPLLHPSSIHTNQTATGDDQQTRVDIYRKLVPRPCHPLSRATSSSSSSSTSTLESIKMDPLPQTKPRKHPLSTASSSSSNSSCSTGTPAFSQADLELCALPTPTEEEMKAVLAFVESTRPQEGDASDRSSTAQHSRKPPALPHLDIPPHHLSIFIPLPMIEPAEDGESSSASSLPISTPSINGCSPSFSPSQSLMMEQDSLRKLKASRRCARLPKDILDGSYTIILDEGCQTLLTPAIVATPPPNSAFCDRMSHSSGLSFPLASPDSASVVSFQSPRTPPPRSASLLGYSRASSLKKFQPSPSSEYTPEATAARPKLKLIT